MRNNKLTPVHTTDRTCNGCIYLGVMHYQGELLDVYVCGKPGMPDTIIVVYPDGTDRTGELVRGITSLGVCGEAVRTYKEVLIDKYAYKSKD